MLDSTTIRVQFDTAFEELSDTLVDLITKETRRLGAEAKAERAAAAKAEKAAAKAQREKAPAPKPPAAPKPSPVSRVRKTLLNRPNVHVVPSNPVGTPPAPVAAPKPTPAPARAPAPWSEYQPSVPKGPSPEELAQKAERFVLASSLPPTFERIRRALRARKDALAPVIDKLVDEKKICLVMVGDVELYKPPRIEPIRRRRPPVASAS